MNLSSSPTNWLIINLTVIVKSLDIILVSFQPSPNTPSAPTHKNKSITFSSLPKAVCCSSARPPALDNISHLGSCTWRWCSLNFLGRDWILTLQLIYCATFNNALNLSRLLFLHLYNESNDNGPPHRIIVRIEWDNAQDFGMVLANS